MAVAQDRFGDLVGVDGTNRVALYFPGLTAQNAANNLSAWPLAPGMIASVLPANVGVPFGTATASSGGQLPMPTTLSNIQVQFQGVPAPLYMVSPTQIDFYVSNNAPTSGLANIVVENTATGQIYGAGLVAMNNASPGLFLNPPAATGTDRQAAIVNYSDGSINSAAHPALRGTYVEILGTGQGYIPGAPADGAAAMVPVPTASRPVVYLQGVSLDDPSFAETNPDGSPVNHIFYSGLAPGMVGVWQIDIKIPTAAPTGGQVVLTVFASSLSSLPSDDYTQYVTTIAIH
jgi:uncharacterized protein (TIGR03437 family)